MSVVTILLEEEVKFRLGSAADGERWVARLGATLVRARHFEVNDLYDRPDRSLRERDEALRLRRVGDEAWLTWKGPQQGSDGIKRRQELESRVSDPDAVEGMLLALGFVVSFRYEKYRTSYRIDEALVTLDETPIGSFVEIEGAAKRIAELAGDLDVAMDTAIQLSYPRLYERHRLRVPEAPPFMIFADTP